MPEFSIQLSTSSPSLLVESYPHIVWWELKSPITTACFFLHLGGSSGHSKGLAGGLYSDVTEISGRHMVTVSMLVSELLMWKSLTSSRGFAKMADPYWG